MWPCYHQWCLVVHLPLDLLPQEPPLWILHTPNSRVVPTLSLESSSRTCSTLSHSMSSTRLVTKSCMYMLNTCCFVLACISVWCLMCVKSYYCMNPAWDLDLEAATEHGIVTTVNSNRDCSCGLTHKWVWLNYFLIICKRQICKVFIPRKFGTMR